MTWSNKPTRTSTAEHKAWALQVLKNSGGHCQLQYPGCTGHADHADHTIPVAEGGPEHDPANGAAACVPCHDIKTRAEQRRGHQRYYARARRQPEQHPGVTP